MTKKRHEMHYFSLLSPTILISTRYYSPLTAFSSSKIPAITCFLIIYIKSSNSDSVLKWINELAKRDGWTDDFTEVIYFKSDFHTSKKEKDVENTGFDVDDEETGYGWYLARTEGGKWRIISSGY